MQFEVRRHLTPGNNWWRNCTTAAALALFLAACGGDSPTQPGPAVSNDTPGAVELPADGGPAVLGVSEAGNGAGQCMQDDSEDAGLTSGGTPLNCTANDIDIASATVTSYSFTGAPGSFTNLPAGSSIQCNEGQTIYAVTEAQLQNNAQERYDIGVWIATDGGDALTGACLHFNLILGETGVSSLDITDAQPTGDVCGDMAQGGLTTVDLDTLQLTCTDNGEGFVEVGACVGWQNQINTEARVCESNDTPQEFRFKTTPDTKSKCNCEPFQLPIVVNQTARLEVRKACVPATIAGATFDLLIDGVVEGNDVACGGTTGAGGKVVGAGTNANPGAVHTFGEGGFTAADYTTTYACVNRVGGGDRGTGTSLGPNNITLQPDDDVICTFTNTRKASLTIVKDAVPNAAQDFDFDGTGTGIPADFDLDDDADGTLQSSIAFTQLVPGGTRTVTETAVSGYTITNIACTGATASTVTIGAAGGFNAGDNSVSVVLAAGENVTCTFTNTIDGSITIVKDAVPNAAQDFDFDGTGTGIPADFDLDDDADGTLSNSVTFSPLTAGGTRTFTESAVAGYTITNIACTGATASTVTIGAAGGFNAGDNSVTIVLAQSENVTCTFTNTRNGTITIIKQTDPDGAPGSFSFAHTVGSASVPVVPTPFTLSDGQQQELLLVTPGTYSVTETVLAGYDLVASGGGFTTGCVDPTTNSTITLATGVASINIAAGENVTCTFVNRQRASLTLNKTEGTVGLPLTRAWEFQLRTGTSETQAGTLVASASANVTTGVISFSGTFVPGSYQLCEVNMPVGYTNNITGFTPLGATPEGGDNSTECINITLVSGANGPGGITGVPNPIHNVLPPPPGGDARTIGYWKNWSSCTGGNQYTKAQQRGELDRTLDYYLSGVNGNPTIYPIGDITISDPLTCVEAVRLLGKSNINTGKKMASDPAYNLAAQFFAAKLNYASGATQCAAATQAITNAQALLDAIGFTGTGTYKNTMTAQQAALANSLAATLDAYNNNDLCPAAP